MCLILGAGFYVNATEDKWSENYNMYDYVTKELPALIESEFNVIPGKKSVMGHSMGGHGALVCALKNPDAYASVSAFSPICNPTKCPWGEKAFTGYLGSVDAGKAYDATELMAANGPFAGFDDILIDQGTADNFLPDGQLLPENFEVRFLYTYLDCRMVCVFVIICLFVAYLCTSGLTMCCFTRQPARTRARSVPCVCRRATTTRTSSWLLSWTIMLPSMPSVSPPETRMRACSCYCGV